ncbi:MAG: hypothetical protein IJW30_01820 [Clostridia bacterium]|nr:hypothetical protein [Clostridia bacterium]
MSTDYLRTAETDAEGARARETLLQDAEAAVERIELCVAQVTRDVRGVETMLDERESDCRAALRRIRETGERLASGLPASRSFFSQTLDKAELKRLCDTVMETERAHHALQDALLCLGEVGTRLQTCRVRVMGAERQAYVLKAAANGTPHEASAADAVKALCALERRCAQAWERLMERRETWGAFSTITLPRFCDGVRRFADLSHGGEESRSGEIRRLCGELRTALNRAL